MSDGPSACARMEERAKREAQEEGYVWEGLTQKEQTRWMFFNERPERSPATNRVGSNCGNCRYWDIRVSVCRNPISHKYNEEVCSGVSWCIHYINVATDVTNFYPPPPDPVLEDAPEELPKPIRIIRKLLLID